MDPMDYTMDDQQSPPANAAHNCQYQHQQQQQRQHLQNPGSFTQHSRDAHHYDPVHNTESWYGPNGPGAQSRPVYAGMQNISHWGQNPYGPIPNWQGLGEAHAGTRGPDIRGYRQHPSFMGMGSPWGEPRSYESLPFGYFPIHSNGLPEPSNPVRSSFTAPMPTSANPMPPQNSSALQPDNTQRSNPSRPSQDTSVSDHLSALRSAARREERASRCLLVLLLGYRG
jgi:hypothetical protein